MTTSKTKQQPKQEAKKAPKMPEKKEAKAQKPEKSGHRVGKPTNPFLERNPNKKLRFE